MRPGIVTRRIRLDRVSASNLHLSVGGTEG